MDRSSCPLISLNYWRIVLYKNTAAHLPPNKPLGTLCSAQGSIVHLRRRQGELSACANMLIIVGHDGQCIPVLLQVTRILAPGEAGLNGEGLSGLLSWASPNKAPLLISILFQWEKLTQVTRFCDNIGAHMWLSCNICSTLCKDGMPCGVSEVSHIRACMEIIDQTPWIHDRFLMLSIDIEIFSFVAKVWMYGSYIHKT